MDAIKSSPDLAQAEGMPGARDLKLVAAVLEKDRKATAEFVELHADSIYGYVHHRLIPRADLVDDIVQEVFLAAWDNLHKFKGTSSLRTWLLGIARHKVESYYRRRLREPGPIAQDEPDSAPYADDPQLEKSLDRERLMARTRKILESLPETYGLVLLWRYWEKRSVRDIARSVDKTEKAVERTLARARKAFKREVESWRRFVIPGIIFFNGLPRKISPLTCPGHQRPPP